MGFCPLKTETTEPAALAAEYRRAEKADVLRLGERHLFFRRGMRVYYIPYGDIQRCFRRVLLVPVKAPRRSVELKVENLVICDAEKELAMVQLRAPREAAPLLERLKKLAPHAAFTKPDPQESPDTGESE